MYSSLRIKKKHIQLCTLNYNIIFYACSTCHELINKWRQYIKVILLRFEKVTLENCLAFHKNKLEDALASIN